MEGELRVKRDVAQQCSLYSEEDEKILWDARYLRELVDSAGGQSEINGVNVTLILCDDAPPEEARKQLAAAEKQERKKLSGMCMIYIMFGLLQILYSAYYFISFFKISFGSNGGGSYTSRQVESQRMKTSVNL